MWICPYCGTDNADSYACCWNCNRTKKQAEEDRMKNTQANNDVLKCPVCGSANLTTNTKGFSAGKALVGGALIGGGGLLAGFIGSDKVRITCLKCGHHWNP